MLILAPLILLVAAVAALQNPHRKAASFKQPANGLRKREVSSSPIEHKYLNKKTESKCRTLPLVGSNMSAYNSLLLEFQVNGTHFPQVPFDIGESYAGLLSNKPHGESPGKHNGESSLFFWFFPSTNPAAEKEVR
mgnify:CR=1 FL=1|jgi:carboxypeptidase D